MGMRRALAILSVLSLCGARRWKQETSDADQRGPSELVQTKSCSNLTQVLDNWKYAIMTQVKDLLVNDYASLLPEYTRIQPLSDAMGDLYKQFNSLKDELGTLTSKFDRVESFVDELQAGKLPPPPAWTASQRPVRRVPPGVTLRAPMRAELRASHRRTAEGPMSTQMRRRRVLTPQD